MKPFFFYLLLLCFFPFCQAQYLGKFTCNEMKPKAGVENKYVYEPPPNLLLPDKIQALIIFQHKQEFYYKTVEVKKTGTKYQFPFKAPDSTSLIIIGMASAQVNLGDYSALTIFKKRIVDNNNGAGFIFYLHNTKGERFSDEKIALAELLYRYPFELDIKATNTSIIKLFSEGYSLHPELKKDNSYPDYLDLLYEEKGDIVRPQLIQYADKMEKIQLDETKWLNAIYVYDLLKMDKEKEALQKKILYTYPNGNLANNKFWNHFNTSYNREGETVQSIIDSMNYYMVRFNDSSYSVKDRFYSKIISVCLANRDWVSLSKAELLINDKSSLEYHCDNFALKLSGKQIDDSGTDLAIAKMLSVKSIVSIEKRIKNITSNDENYDEERGAYNKYINTYALILYKLGQFDSAFYYQDVMYQRGNELNVGGLERYAVYAEKVKGVVYARQVLEQQLISGVNSTVMLQQLQNIYKQLKLPENSFTTLQEKSYLVAREKSAALIRKKLGTTKALNFALKNLAGQIVSLSSMKGKVVVLDFWATWCGPCIASFPAMQEAINQYKKDLSVVFLFIDVWEHKLPQKMQESTAKFIKDGNYDFNVLLDINDKVVSDYKITGIPAKFIIDKKGNVVFMGETSNIVTEIEAARKLIF